MGEGGEMYVPRARWRTALGMELRADSGCSGSAGCQSYYSLRALWNAPSKNQRTEEALEDLCRFLGLTRKGEALDEVLGLVSEFVRAFLEEGRRLDAGLRRTLAELV